MTPCRPVARTSVLISALIVLACGGGTEPLDDGSHSGTVGGAVTASFSGNATFFLGSDGMAVVLEPPGPLGWLLGFAVFPSGRPAAGATLEVVPPAPPRPETPHAFVLVSELSGAGERSWMSQSGELRITASSPERIAGTFEFTARPSDDGSSAGDITVSGTFEAVCTPRGSC
jgi:hypothetical protein